MMQIIYNTFQLDLYKRTTETIWKDDSFLQFSFKKNKK